MMTTHNIEQTIFSVYAIEWTEFERGWGQRPDGISYHCNKHVADRFIKEEWTDKIEDVAPEIYSKPGTPKLIECTKEQYEFIKSKGCSTWTLGPKI